MTPYALTVASGAFESARQLPGLPEGHRSRGLHGHSFQASVFAALPVGWAAFAGGEVSGLRDRMAQVLAGLSHQDLNRLLVEPGDEALAQTVRERLAVPGVQRLALQSTRTQGVDLNAQGAAQVWRRYKFQSAHRLPNVPLGHKCGRMHGHGFEAVVHAQLAPGEPACLAYDRLDALWAPLHFELNYQCLNRIEGLSNPTSEIVSSWLWQRLQPQAPGLVGVTVFETGSCGAHFDGAQYRIWKDFTLDSAVQLRRAPADAPEHGLHGHTFGLRLHLRAPLDTVQGWTVDFGDVKTIFDPVFKALDHRPLHEMAGLADSDTTSLAHWIYGTTRAQLPQLVRVDLFETEGCGASVAQDVHSPVLPV